MSLLQANSSISKIHYLIKDLGFTRKRVKRVVRKSMKYKQELEIKRNHFIEKMKTTDKTKVISIDESGFHKEMTPLYRFLA